MVVRVVAKRGGQVVLYINCMRLGFRQMAVEGDEGGSQGFN